METKQVIKYGICADNKDPHSAGRIRVLFDIDMSEIFRKNSNPEALIRDIDNNETKKYGDNSYEPWFIGNNIEKTDPYTVEPFHPKHFHLIPKIGESVKVIFYNVNSNSSPKEYIGPHNSKKSELQYEDPESGRAFSKISNTRLSTIDLTTNRFIPKETDIGLIGRYNSDLVLPDNSVYLRAGHKNYNDLTIDTNQTLFQMSSFQSKSSFNKKEVTNNFTPTKPISHLVQYEFNDEEIINGNIKIFNSKGINNNNYSTVKNYNFEDVLFEIFIETNSFDRLNKFINNLLNELDNRKIKLSDKETLGNDNDFLKYELNDNRLIDNGQEFFDPFLYAFRANPNFNNNVIKRLKDNISNQLRPINKIPQEETKTEEVIEFNRKEGNENITINGSDKLFFLSWQENPNLKNNIEGYGIPQRNLYKLEKNTQPLVKGDKFIDIILKIVNIIEKHGHRYDGPDTLTENVKEDVQQLKNDLNKNVNDDLSGGPEVVNQYLRIS